MVHTRPREIDRQNSQNTVSWMGRRSPPRNDYEKKKTDATSRRRCWNEHYKARAHKKRKRRASVQKAWSLAAAGLIVGKGLGQGVAKRGSHGVPKNETRKRRGGKNSVLWGERMFREKTSCRPQEEKKRSGEIRLGRNQADQRGVADHRKRSLSSQRNRQGKK